MADNVAARKDSGWIVVCTTPDVCKTPVGSSTPPIPYRVTAKMEDAARPVPDVKANGKPVVVLTQSFIPKTLGDEPGVAKGVQSGTVGDISEPLEHSNSVKAGGHHMLRHDDQFYMNNKNTIGRIQGQPPSTSKTAAESNPPVVPETPAEKSNAGDKPLWTLTPEEYGAMMAISAMKNQDVTPEEYRRAVVKAGEAIEKGGGARALAAFNGRYNPGIATLAGLGKMAAAGGMGMGGGARPRPETAPSEGAKPPTDTIPGKQGASGHGAEGESSTEQPHQPETGMTSPDKGAEGAITEGGPHSEPATTPVDDTKPPATPSAENASPGAEAQGNISTEETHQPETGITQPDKGAEGTITEEVPHSESETTPVDDKKPPATPPAENASPGTEAESTANTGETQADNNANGSSSEEAPEDAKMPTNSPDENAPSAPEPGATILGENEAQGTKGKENPTNNTSCEGEPVDMVTGDFHQHLSVLTVPGTLPLTLTRFYRSRSEKEGLLGPKWTDEWSCILELDDREIHFTDHEGVTLTYPLPVSGVIKDAVNSRVSGYVLSGDVNGELRVFNRRSQQQLVFGEVQGQLRRLSAIRDGYGNTATFLYRDERLVQVRHSDGHVLDLAWQDGRLAMITLTAQGKTQRLVTCRHDERGMLAECDSFQFAHTWHRYSPQGFMVFWRDADGTQVDLRYDAQGRVTETKTPEGYYNDRFIYNDAERQNTYLDAQGGQTHYWYNEDGLAVRRVDPLGRETLTAWENHRRKSVTDALGRVTEWDYNRHGEITRLSLPGGITLHYRYDDNGNLTRFQGPGNKVWLFDYDEHGGLLRVTDPQGRQGSRLYGDHGELLQQVLPDGETWRYGYDPLHRLSRVEDPLQGETLLTQDMLGRLLEVRDPLRQVTIWQYSTQHASPEGSVTQTTLPDGVVQRQAYSAGKKVASFTDGEGKTTCYEYGSFDRVMAVVRPDGQRYAFEYDGLLRLKQVTDAEGKTWRYDRDLAGQVIRETDFTGRVMVYEYDAAGRRICTRHPDGHLIRWYYDHGDRLLRQQVFRLREGHEQPATTTDYAYDSEYRLISATTPDARVEFEYDAHGNVTAETVNGHRVEHSYDPLSGRPVAWRLDGVEMAFTWGAMGRLAQWQVNGHAPLRLSHNALGRETQRHSDAGFLHGQRHSETGNLIEQWAGRMAAGATDLPQDVSRSMAYDRAYNITRIADHRWGDTRYRHDRNDQIILAEGGVRTLPREEAFSYDASLNLTRHGQTPNLHYGVMQFTAYVQQSGRAGKDHQKYTFCTK